MLKEKLCGVIMLMNFLYMVILMKEDKTEGRKIWLLVETALALASFVCGIALIFGLENL